MLERNQMTITDLAKEMDMTRQNVSQKIKSESFSTHQLYRIAEIFNTGISIVFDEFASGHQPLNTAQEQPPKRSPGRPNKYKEQQKEFRERLFSEDPDLPDDTRKIINETPLIKGEKFEDYRGRIGHIAWEQYMGNPEEDQSDESEYEGMTEEDAVLHDFLKAPNRTEEQKAIAHQFPPMDGEEDYYYTKRILELESTMKNDKTNRN